MFDKLTKFLARIEARKLYQTKRKTAFPSPAVTEVETRVCKFCGKTFTPIIEKQIFCSRECCYQSHKKNHGKTFEKNCAVCGKPFTTKQPNQFYCSEKCRMVNKKKRDSEYNKIFWEKRRQENAKKLVGRVCKQCGKTFDAKISSQLYCSKDCRNKATAKRNKAKPTEKICVICGKKFTTKSRVTNTCSVECAKVKYFGRPKTQPAKIACKNCGKFFTPSSSLNIFCSAECRTQFHNVKKFILSKSTRQNKNVDTKKTAFPSKSKKKSVEDWQREAAQCGMSYGKYRFAIEKQGKTFDELKRPAPAPVDSFADGNILYYCEI